MEYKREIKTEENLLSELNFKIVELKTKNGRDDFYFLGDDLKETLAQKLDTFKIRACEGFELWFELSYCQGDGLCFTGTFLYKGCVFVITHTGRYYHHNSVDITCSSHKGKDISELTKKQLEKAEAIGKEFEQLYHKICLETEDIGYSIIEDTEEGNVLKMGFQEWLDVNDLDCPENAFEIFDMDYKTEKADGYVKICDSGDTHMKGLWIKDQKVTTKEFLNARIWESKEQKLEG